MRYDQEDLGFLCPTCAGSPGQDVDLYDFDAALERLESVVTMEPFDETSEQFKRCVSTEKLLLETYDIKLPAEPDVISYQGRPDNMAIGILQELSPHVLSSHVPLTVGADGNCLYRALSRALYGHEDVHLHIRLLTALEIASNPEYYSSFISGNDAALMVEYKFLLRDAATVGCWSETLHIYAASAALNMPIHMFSPPSARFCTTVLTRNVCGRNVNAQANLPRAKLMWTICGGYTPGSDYKPDHFVVLAEHSQQREHSPQSPTPHSIVEVHTSPDSSPEQYCTPSLEVSSIPENPPQSPTASDDKSSFHAEEDPDTGIQQIGSPRSPGTSLSPPYPPPQSPWSEPEEGDDNDSDMMPSVPPAEGGHGLPFPGKFMETSHLFNILSNQETMPLDGIPMGRKQECYYVFDNTDNMERRQNNIKGQFWDDCGAWVAGASNSDLFVCDDNHKLTKVVLQNGEYGTRSSQRTRTGRRYHVTPLNPQPQPDEVFVLHRAYYTHTQNSDYKRRISWITNNASEMNKRACAEYVGLFPGRGLHGGSRQNTREYIRTNPKTMDKIKDKVQHQTPNQVWQEFTEPGDIINGPRSRKQIQNAKYNLKKNRSQSTLSKSNNFSNDIQKLLTMTITDGDFVRSVSVKSSRVPTIILYTDYQIQDIKRFCCSDDKAHSTVLAFDKTFNLTNVHLTLGVFKNLAVKRRDTDDHPIFPGPMFLHGSHDFATFHEFFSALSAELRDTSSTPVFGSDDETALKNAIKQAFPSSPTLTCTRHLKKNVKHELSDKIGVPREIREEIVKLIFGKGGVTSAADELQHKYRMDQIKEFNTTSAPAFVDYFTKFVEPLLETNFRTKLDREWTASLGDWTNNNCESMNHVLKQIVKWKTVPLPTLVSELKALVKTQYKDLQRALVGQGDYELCKPFKQGRGLTIEAWNRMGAIWRQGHFDKFMKKMWLKNKRTSISTDGNLAVTGPNSNGGKKPGQRKRRRAEKTTSIPKRHNICRTHRMSNTIISPAWHTPAEPQQVQLLDQDL